MYVGVCRDVVGVEEVGVLHCLALEEQLDGLRIGELKLPPDLSREGKETAIKIFGPQEAKRQRGEQHAMGCTAENWVLLSWGLQRAKPARQLPGR